ncbi:MAG: carboxypeptidase regulatory-like domain-containing protein [Candidatus Methanomarinus sp.]|uniref:Carboxypeptidase regulatory-like domain-containing protein n=1 Tax=Candidatus Methanomarinus sp. TaxID=3386244 RepID=A0AC61SAI7_9EURY|nr:MAG: carboxypeptidase regulatory-like domain-containing protein [ANME-2 cluster archaeon]
MIKRMNRIWIVLFIIAAIGMLVSGLSVNTFGSDGKNGTGLNTSYGNNTTVAGEGTFLNFTFNASDDTYANITSLDISFPDGFNLTPISNDSENIILTGFNGNIGAKNCTITGTKVLKITNSTLGGCIWNTTSGSYFSVNLTNTSNFIIPTSSGIYPIILSVTNATDDVAETTVNLKVNPVPGPGPKITGIGPSSSDISDHEGAARTFNITVNQTVDINWMVNGAVVQTNADTTSDTYTNSNARPGIHTVKAVATNSNGTDTQTWNWTVIENGSIRGKITDNRTGEPVSYAKISAVNKSGDTVITAFSRSDGTYVISSIINGTYTLNVSEHDYKWNSDSTVIVLPGELNSNGNVALSPDMVILSIKPGESTVKAAVAGNATIFNLTATNYGDNATFEVDYSSIFS